MQAIDYWYACNSMASPCRMREFKRLPTPAAVAAATAAFRKGGLRSERGSEPRERARAADGGGSNGALGVAEIVIGLVSEGRLCVPYDFDIIARHPGDTAVGGAAAAEAVEATAAPAAVAATEARGARGGQHIARHFTISENVGVGTAAIAAPAAAVTAAGDG